MKPKFDMDQWVKVEYDDDSPGFYRFQIKKRERCLKDSPTGDLYRYSDGTLGLCGYNWWEESELIAIPTPKPAVQQKLQRETKKYQRTVLEAHALIFG